MPMLAVVNDVVEARNSTDRTGTRTFIASNGEPEGIARSSKLVIQQWQRPIHMPASAFAQRPVLDRSSEVLQTGSSKPHPILPYCR